jgi:hypothetical protein
MKPLTRLIATGANHPDKGWDLRTKGRGNDFTNPDRLSYDD